MRPRASAARAGEICGDHSNFFQTFLLHEAHGVRISDSALGSLVVSEVTPMIGNLVGSRASHEDYVSQDFSNPGFFRRLFRFLLGRR
ncbi:MAG TPA: hypothetical protein VGG48_05390 [Rhizomicrobium sp.]|jgi:hypothetical protein